MDDTTGMKKITHLSSAHPWNDVRIFHKQCLTARKLGYNVSLIAQAEHSQISQNIKIKALPLTRSRITRITWTGLLLYVKALKEKADLYQFHDPELIIIGLLLRLHGKKVIYDVHEDVPRDILLKEWLPKLVRVIVSKLFELFENYSARFFNAVITVTPHINNRFKKYDAVEIRNYPIIVEYTKNTDKSANLFICYSGLINASRGLSEMVAASKMTNSTLVLAGRFSCEKTQQNILALPHVLYLGYLNRKSLVEIYHQSIVGLALLHPSPTFKDSLPIKLFEYMAAGIPVIASDFALWRDIIEKHGCGFCISPFDIEGISQLITYLKNNIDEAKAMGQRGQLAVAQYYNWHSQEEKLSSLYQRLLASR